MTYRGIVKQGVIVLSDGGTLADGQEVQVLPLPPVEAAAVRTEPLPGFGLWSDRTDLPDDSEEAARVLRRRANERHQLCSVANVLGAGRDF